MKNRNLLADDNWLTPEWLYDELNKEFNFDFDPCPYNTGIITPQNDGLIIPWGKSNFVNPPYSRQLKEKFIIRAAEETSMRNGCNGNLSVLLLPVSTSTKIFHDVIYNFAEIRFLKGRVKFQKLDEYGKRYTPKNGGMHDSMICIFRPL